MKANGFFTNLAFSRFELLDMVGNLESQLAAVKDILNVQVIVSEISFFHFMRQDRLKLKITVL